MSLIGSKEKNTKYRLTKLSQHEKMSLKLGHNKGANKMRSWDVKLNGKVIDTVFYDDDCDADYVRRGLINHDGYDPRITICDRDEGNGTDFCEFCGTAIYGSLSIRVGYCVECRDNGKGKNDE